RSRSAPSSSNVSPRPSWPSLTSGSCRAREGDWPKIRYMPEAYIVPIANRLGAVALTLSDRVREAAERATGMTGGAPAALVSLREWADGESVEVLAGAMRVSHSRAVRVVDRLEADGLARREQDPSDGRRALVWLEPD